MTEADKVALIAAILTAARIQRGVAPDSNGIREAVKTAEQIVDTANHCLG